MKTQLTQDNQHMKPLQVAISLSLCICFLLHACKEDAVNPSTSCAGMIDGFTITTDSFPRMQKQQDIYFLNENVGYAVGNAATITKTSDGGRNWKRLHYNFDNGYNKEAITDVVFNTVWFVNESIGYVAGERESDFSHEEFSDAVLLKTTDGGETWTKIYVPGTKEIFDITFFDAMTGIGIFKLTNPSADSALEIRRTTDGGLTWSTTVLQLNRLYKLKFYHTPSKVLCINDDGTEHPALWSTLDHGLTWQSIALPQTHFADLYFIDEQHVIGSFAYQQFERSLYGSADGGLTWEEFETPFSAKEIMHFSSPQQGFIINGIYKWETGGWESWPVLVGTEIYQTADGGHSWDRKEVSLDCYVEGVPFRLDADNLYVLKHSKLQRISR